MRSGDVGGGAGVDRRRDRGGLLLGDPALLGLDVVLKLDLAAGQAAERGLARLAGGGELGLLGLERSALVGEGLALRGDLVAGLGDPLLSLGEARDGVLGLGAKIGDPLDDAGLVVVDAIEVGGVDGGVLPAGSASIRSLTMLGSSDL